jgi:ribonuclease R
MGGLHVVGAGDFDPRALVTGGLGDRYLLRFDGLQMTVIGHYSSGPSDDVQVLLGLYGRGLGLGLGLGLGPTFDDIKGNALYTVDSVVDHSDLDTFTIDPTTSVDFDDAISVVGSTVYIHIVDIAGQLDKFDDISKRNLQQLCLTLYLANEHTSHLLTESDVAAVTLGAGVARAVITVKVVLDMAGLVVSYDIYRSTIVVKRRLNYGQVAEMLKAGTAGPAIEFLQHLSAARSADVSYNISLPSARLTIDNDTGLLADLTMENTNDDAHTLVATVMILANLVVSKHLAGAGLVLPNRFHDKLRGFVAPDFVSTGDVGVDSFIMIKRWSRACYSVDQKGHFGLGLTDYVHFTSPMRRYADVLVHRLLAGWRPDVGTLSSEVAHLNMQAGVVRMCQDLYTTWKVGRHLTVGAVYKICITDVKKAGVMWFMPDYSLNGFTHVTKLLPSMWWDYADGVLKGARTVGLGDWFTGTLVSVCPITYAVTLTINVV